MDEACYKPVPTEWKGVVYRSKSEACMAKFLSNFGRVICGKHVSSIVIYEPFWLADNNWVPDFLVITQEIKSQATFGIVEYKPAEPTKTYLDNLAERFNSIFDASGSFSKRVEFELWYGSFFEDSPHIVLEFDGDEWCEKSTTWKAGMLLKPLILESRKHRFDLEAKS